MVGCNYRDGVHAGWLFGCYGILQCTLTSFHARQVRYPQSTMTNAAEDCCHRYRGQPCSMGSSLSASETMIMPLLLGSFRTSAWRMAWIGVTITAACTKPGSEITGASAQEHAMQRAMIQDGSQLCLIHTLACSCVRPIRVAMLMTS